MGALLGANAIRASAIVAFTSYVLFMFDESDLGSLRAIGAVGMVIGAAVTLFYKSDVNWFAIASLLVLSGGRVFGVRDTLAAMGTMLGYVVTPLVIYGLTSGDAVNDAVDHYSAIFFGLGILLIISSTPMWRMKVL